MAVIMGSGLLFYILLGCRYRSLGSRVYLGFKVPGYADVIGLGFPKARIPLLRSL